MKQRKHSSRNKASKGQSIRFRKSALAVCVAAVAAQAQVYAQTDSGAQIVEEVVVTGQRLNLRNAQEMKRNADTFVDAISAQDIGQLPDASVVEALQRVPGISLERFAASNDPDHFSTEGSDVTLRGLPQTRTGINGRDSVAADSSNGLGFDDISPELLGSVEIFKNQTADMIEGGIAGTINLNTRKPFDSEERVIAFTAQVSEGNLSEDSAPGFSGVFSDRFDVEAGEIGVLASYSRNDLTFRADGSELGQHQLVEDAAGAGEDRYVPINAGVRSTTTERTRESASLALQFRNNADTFEGTLEYIRSDSETDWLEYAFFSDDQGRSGLSADSTFNDTSFTGGTLTGLSNGLGPQTRGNDTDELLEEFTLNAAFQANDRLSIEVDVQRVEASTDVTDLSVFGGIIPRNHGGIDIQVDAAGDTPRVDFLAPSGSGQTDEEFYLDPANYFFRAAMDHLEESEGDQTAFQFDLDYELEHDLLDSVEVGARFAERDQTTRWSTFNWGNLSEDWAGGYVDFNGDRLEVGAPFSVASSLDGAPGVSSFGFPGFHNGNAGGAVNALFINPEVVQSYDAFLTAVAPFGRGSLADRGGVVEGTSYLPSEVNRVTEDNTAFYAKLNFGGDTRWSGNVGLRYVDVETSVSGGESFLLPGGNLVPTAEEQAFFNGASIVESTSSTYSKVLPSLNLKYGISDDMLVRFAYSQSVAFADSGNLRYNYIYTADVQDGTINRVERRSGNPFLDPMESDDYDLSIEWYFGDSSSLTAGVFYKDIEGFFSNDTFVENITNNGVTLPVTVNTTINVGQGKLKGFEFAYQQFFDGLPGAFSNLGIQFNATLLSESGVPNQNTRPVQSGGSDDVDRASLPFDGLPLEGLSEETFNFVGMYEGDKIRGRLAYNYRSDYLLTIRHVNLGVPVFNEDRGQLDGSIFYKMDNGLEIGLQAQNLNNAPSNTRMQVNQEGDTVVRNSFVNDRRFALVLKGSF